MHNKKVHDSLKRTCKDFGKMKNQNTKDNLIKIIKKLKKFATITRINAFIAIISTMLSVVYSQKASARTAKIIDNSNQFLKKFDNSEVAKHFSFYSLAIMIIILISCFSSNIAASQCIVYMLMVALFENSSSFIHPGTGQNQISFKKYALILLSGPLTNFNLILATKILKLAITIILAAFGIDITTIAVLNTLFESLINANIATAFLNIIPIAPLNGYLIYNHYQRTLSNNTQALRNSQKLQLYGILSLILICWADNCITPLFLPCLHFGKALSQSVYFYLIINISYFCTLNTLASTNNPNHSEGISQNATNNRIQNLTKDIITLIYNHVISNDPSSFDDTVVEAVISEQSNDPTVLTGNTIGQDTEIAYSTYTEPTAHPIPSAPPAPLSLFPQYRDNHDNHTNSETSNIQRKQI